jgi:hypothetical protein
VDKDERGWEKEETEEGYYRHFSILICCMELFCQTDHKNGSSSIDGAIHGAETKNGFTSEKSDL